MTPAPRVRALRPAQGTTRRLALALAGGALLAALATVSLEAGPLAPGPADAAPTAAPATTTGPTTTAAEAAPPASSTTSTTQAAARCDPVAPTAVLFVGTVVSRRATVVRFYVDEVRLGPRLAGTEVDVTYLRDARFFDEGERYLVTAALDPDTNLYVSKVRTRRGEDPRCTARDPISTTLANGTPIDTGVFTGLKGTRGKVVRAFLLPLAAAVGVLAALVAVKWLAIYAFRGVRRLTRGPTG